jgi:hypothetical protein
MSSTKRRKRRPPPNRKLAEEAKATTEKSLRSHVGTETPANGGAEVINPKEANLISALNGGDEPAVEEAFRSYVVTESGVEVATTEEALRLTKSRYHNAPELADLDAESRVKVDSGAEAISAIKKTFDHWMAIARGVAVLRREADRIGGKKTFHEVLEKNGYAVLMRSRSNLTRLVQIAAQEDEVQAWHGTLTENQKWDWAGPSAVFKHCPLFKKPPKDPAAPHKMTLTEANRKLQEDVELLEQRVKASEAAELIQLDEDVDAIAFVLVDRFALDKAEAVAKAMLKQIEAQRAAEKVAST